MKRRMVLNLVLSLFAAMAFSLANPPASYAAGEEHAKEGVKHVKEGIVHVKEAIKHLEQANDPHAKEAIEHAKEAIKAEAAEIAIELAEKKLKEKLTTEEQEKLLEESIAKIGGSN